MSSLLTRKNWNDGVFLGRLQIMAALIVFYKQCNYSHTIYIYIFIYVHMHDILFLSQHIKTMHARSVIEFVPYVLHVSEFCTCFSLAVYLVVYVGSGL